MSWKKLKPKEKIQRKRGNLLIQFKTAQEEQNGGRLYSAISGEPL